MGCKDNERLREAREQLEIIQADKRLMYLMQMEDMYASDQTTMIDNAKDEGREEGKKEKE